MATLILTAVGTAIGGPVGGAIGALVGQSVDARIFAPKGRSGPRLGDRSVQTSSYGTAIPKLFGSMRVAGTVVWATDLKETKSKSGGSKGQPKVTNYSYSASFAVALSGRPIQGVGRIWADGKLLRGAAGDFKSRTGYRLYPGGEDQPADPLIAAAEGIGQATAFRGIAYAMFEDFQLEDYGNHIPSLTFEVTADAGPVTIGAVAAAISGGAIIDRETPSVVGYAASGDSVRGAIETLSNVVPLSLADAGDVVRIGVPGGDATDIVESEAGTAGETVGGGRTELTRLAATAVADEVSISYYDPARDYQTGLQRASLGGHGLRTEELALPAALGADAAKAIAERRLAWLGAGRATAKVHLPWRRADLRPGGLARIEGQAGLWKVERWTLDHMVTSLELTRIPTSDTATSAPASPGRPVGEPDAPIGPTTLLLLDLPPLTDPSATRPQMAVLAAGGEGWRRSALAVSYDLGASWEEIGATAGAAVMGHAVDALGESGSALIDTAGAVEVELLNDAMWLESRTDDALVGGANLAMLGDELIQFGSALPLGGRRFRLTHLLRGRRGTEWAAATHAPGEPFALVDRDALTLVEPPAGTIGGEIELMATGIGDAIPIFASRAVAGEAVRPPAPAHLAAARAANGDITIRWTRRSRSGWAWIDGSDAPLGEESESYELSVAGAGFARTTNLTAPAYVYSAADQAMDGAAGPLAISVTQAGTIARSRPAQISFD